ncbi:MAG: PfkB family carbohydrate kinase [Acidothermaceae bacterium]
MLTIKPAEACRYDAVSLGEVMLRLDPGETRIRAARQFRAWEGGGEYNVTRGLRRAFGLRTAVVTALADNEIGRLVEEFIMAGGVDTSLIRWVPYDGIGRGARNGLNFTERGFGLRGAVGVSDRGHTAVSQLKAGSIDWDAIFGAGVRWFHTGGIFAALSETTAGVVLEATSAARKHGTVVSYDLNYRPSLWRDFGGQQAAREVNREIAKSVDVMIGNEEDFAACLGIETPGGDENLSDLDPENFKAMIGEVTRQFPNLKVVATTLRTAVSASRNHWAAVAWSDDGGFAESVQRMNLEILDRVGGGDSFASGLAYGLLSGKGVDVAVEYGAAHGALAMTTPGDTSMATLREVEAAMAGAGTRIQR